MPDTVKVDRIVPPGELCARAENVPDQAVQEIEWSMHHTIPEFSRKIVDAWKVKESADDGVIVFTYWENCVTGKAAVYWNAVVIEYHKGNKRKTYKTWMS